MNDENQRIRDQLWNPDVSPQSYEGPAEKYQAAILDQYKIYVEMADRISARRGLTNTFFLTLNTSIVAALSVLVGVLGKTSTTLQTGSVVLLLAAILGQCGAWWWLVRSYRLLNAAKFRVIGAMEERLPASAYWKAEWVALGEGKDLRKYLPLTHIEQWVPVGFALVYVSGFLMLTVK